MRRWFWPTNVAMRPTVAKNAFEKMLFVIKNAFFVLPKIHPDAHRGLIAAGSSGAHRVKFPSSSGGSSLVSFLI